MYIGNEYIIKVGKKHIKTELHLENNLAKNNKNNVIIEYKLGKIQTQF